MPLGGSARNFTTAGSSLVEFHETKAYNKSHWCLWVKLHVQFSDWRPTRWGGGVGEGSDTLKISQGEGESEAMDVEDLVKDSE